MAGDAFATGVNDGFVGGVCRLEGADVQAKRTAKRLTSIPPWKNMFLFFNIQFIFIVSSRNYSSMVQYLCLSKQSSKRSYKTCP